MTNRQAVGERAEKLREHKEPEPITCPQCGRVRLSGRACPFCGFEAKLPGRFFVQGEYDSRDLNAAIGWQPVDLFRIKAYTIRSESYFGAELVPVTF